MTKEKILITGASGFVGSFLVEEALSRDLEVYAGIRKSSSTRYLQDERINLCYPDFESEENLIKLIDEIGIDYIIHNAGVTRAQNSAEYFRINSDYTVRLAKAAMNATTGLKKFVFMSSLEAYGSADNTPQGYLEENSPQNPRTEYGKSKLRAEKELQQITDLPWIILRPTGVFGPREKDFLSIFQTIKKYRIAPVVGTDKIKYTFVYVKDLVRVSLDAVIAPLVQRSYFVNDGKIYSIKNFTGAIAKALDLKPFSITIPYLLLDGVVILTGLLDKVTGSKSLLNEEQLAKMKAQNWDADISPLVKDFGYCSQYTLEDAILETTKWYEEADLL